jgi:hypothetical protein
VRGPRRGRDAPAQAAKLAVKCLGRGLGLERPGHQRRVGVVTAGGVDQLGQRVLARGIDEQAADLAQGVVAGGTCDGQRAVQRFVDGQDLLDHDPGVGSGEVAQPCEIAGRIGQPVGMIDAQAIDEPFVEPALDLGVRGVEDRAVLLAEPGQ